MYRSLNTAFLGFEAEVETAVQAARSGGFGGVDLSREQAVSIQVSGNSKKFRELFAEHDIRPGCFLLTPGNFSGAPADWKLDIERLPELGAALSEVGFRRVLIVVLPFDKDLAYGPNFDRHVTRIRQVADILLPFGILVGLEYIAPLTRRRGYRHAFVHDLSGALELRSAVERPNVGVFLDCFHWYCARERVKDLEMLDPSWIAGTHISDAVAGRGIDEQLAFERQLPGTSGLINLNEFLGTLQTIGYDGPVTCEPMVKAFADLPLQEAVKRTAEAIDLSVDGLV